MKYWSSFSLVFLVLAIGCHSLSPEEKQANANIFNKAFAEAFSPVYDLSVMANGSLPVIYASGSFYSKNNRWPTNYAELSSYVTNSNGYLFLGEYANVVVKPLTNDAFEIRFVQKGTTMERKMTLSPPVESK